MGFKLKVPQKVSYLYSNVKIQAKIHSPEILLACGITSMVGAVIFAAKATRKVDQIMADHEERLNAAKAEIVIPDDREIAVLEASEVDDISSLITKKSEKEIKRQVRHEYAVTGFRVGKAYAPVAALLTLSSGCFISMHNIQARRFTALSGAYTGLREAFDAYQRRNIELNGKKNHEMCKYGYKEVEESYEDPDTGEMVTEKKLVPDYESLTNETMGELWDANGLYLADNFLKLSKETCGEVWQRDTTLNRMFVNVAIQNLLDKYYTKKFLTMAEVCEELNIAVDENNAAFMFLGWVYGMTPDPLFVYEGLPVNEKFDAGYKDQDLYLSVNIGGNVYTMLSNMKKAKEEMRQNLERKRLEEES